MNFNSIMEELDRLYEAQEEVEQEDEVAEEVAEEIPEEEEAVSVEEEMPEEEADEEIEIEIDDDTVVPEQVVLGCSKCGGLVLKAVADLVVDAESGLANVEDVCEYCEEANGYEVVGGVVPYEVAVSAEEVEESEEAENEEAAEVEATVEEADTEADAEVEEVSAKESLDVDLQEYYDEEAPMGRNRSYGSSGVRVAGDWGDPVPKWWLTQGGTEQSWKNRRQSRYVHDDETGRARQYYESAEAGTLTEEADTADIENTVREVASKYSEKVAVIDRGNGVISVSTALANNGAAAHEDLIKLLASKGFEVKDDYFAPSDGELSKVPTSYIDLHIVNKQQQVKAEEPTSVK